MKKLFITLILICFLVIPSNAMNPCLLEMVAGGVEACGAGSPTLVFWWDCSVENMGSNICTDSWSDESFSVKNGDITVVSGYVDTVDSGANGDDTYELTAIGTDEFPIGNFTIEFKLYINSHGDDIYIWKIGHIAVTDYMHLNLQSDAGSDLGIYRRTGGAEDVNITFDTNLSASTWYFIVLRLSTTDGPDLWISTTKWPDVNTGGSWIEGSDTMTAWASADQVQFQVGNDQATAADYYIGKPMKIYDGWKTY